MPATVRQLIRRCSGLCGANGGIFPADGRCTAIYTAKSPALNDSKKCQLKQVLHKKTRKPYSGAGFEGLNDTE
jgi:hypothetical protein